MGREEIIGSINSAFFFFCLKEIKVELLCLADVTGCRFYLKKIGSILKAFLMSGMIWSRK